jgi:hypothetical protein
MVQEALAKSGVVQLFCTIVKSPLLVPANTGVSAPESVAPAGRVPMLTVNVAVLLVPPTIVSFNTPQVATLALATPGVFVGLGLETTQGRPLALTIVRAAAPSAFPAAEIVTELVPSVTEKVAVKLAGSPVGAKPMVMVHLAAGAKAAVQVLPDTGNMPKLPPLVRVSAPVATPPLLVMVTVCAVPAVFTRTLPKSRERGEADRLAPEIPVPVRFLTAGAPLVP